jgi:hypothetical protein
LGYYFAKEPIKLGLNGIGREIKSSEATEIETPPTDE